MLDIMDKDMLELFFEDTADMLDNCIDRILDAKGIFDDDVIEEIMRTMHSIKGASSMIDLYCLEGFAHKLEDIFIDIKERKIDITDDFVDVIIESVNVLRKRLEIRKDLFLKKHFEFNKDLKDEKEEIDNMSAKIDSVIDGIKKPGAISQNELENLNNELERNRKKLYKMEVYFDEKAEMFELKKIMVKNNLEEIGEVIDSEPSEEDLLESQSSKYTIIYESEADLEEILTQMEVGDIYFILISSKENIDFDEKDYEVMYMQKRLKYEEILDFFDLWKEIVSEKSPKKIVLKDTEMDIYGIQLSLLLKKLGLEIA